MRRAPGCKCKLVESPNFQNTSPLLLEQCDYKYILEVEVNQKVQSRAFTSRAAGGPFMAAEGWIGPADGVGCVAGIPYNSVEQRASSFGGYGDVCACASPLDIHDKAPGFPCHASYNSPFSQQAVGASSYIANARDAGS